MWSEVENLCSGVGECRRRRVNDLERDERRGERWKLC